MRKIILALLLLLALTGCQQKITTYKEVIKDGKIEIDGISYDIKSVTKSAFTYDDNGNLIEKVTTKDDSETRFERLYENDQLIKEIIYVDDKLATTRYYYYEDDLLMKMKNISERGFEMISEYSYGDNIKSVIQKDSSGEILWCNTAHLDDDENILSITSTNTDGEVMNSSTYYYENNQLKKIINKKHDNYITTFNYEYNNIGDKIMEYNISHGEVKVLRAIFYDYEYYDNLLPKTTTVYQIGAPIEDENIRDY